MYEDLRGRLEELAKIELHDDGMGVYRISAEGLEIIKGLATAAEAAIEDLSEQISEQEVTPEAGHFIDKYADRILSELQELKGSIKEKPRWIPVTERPPEDGEDVLCWISDNRRSGQGYEMVGCYNSTLKLWDMDADWVSSLDITHWRTLPEPPEEEE